MLFAMAGEPAGLPPELMEPKLMFGRAPLGVWGAPLGIWPEAPAALMVTEGLRECSDMAAAPLAAELLTIAGAAMLFVGGRLLTDSRFPWCAVDPPLLPTTSGPDTEDLVAWA